MSLAHDQEVLAAVYFGFIGLIAWNKPLLGIQVIPGLSLGILLGAGVVLACWSLTWIYVCWANAHYDPVLSRLRSDEGGR